MVRETRHLWVGNLPENIREDRIREHFKRYVDGASTAMGIRMLLVLRSVVLLGICAAEEAGVNKRIDAFLQETLAIEGLISIVFHPCILWSTKFIYILIQNSINITELIRHEYFKFFERLFRHHLQGEDMLAVTYHTAHNPEDLRRDIFTADRVSDLRHFAVIISFQYGLQVKAAHGVPQRKSTGCYGFPICAAVHRKSVPVYDFTYSHRDILDVTIFTEGFQFCFDDRMTVMTMRAERHLKLNSRFTDYNPHTQWPGIGNSCSRSKNFVPDSQSYCITRVKHENVQKWTRRFGVGGDTFQGIIVEERSDPLQYDCRLSGREPTLFVTRSLRHNDITCMREDLRDQRTEENLLAKFLLSRYRTVFPFYDFGGICAKYENANFWQQLYPSILPLRVTTEGRGHDSQSSGCDLNTEQSANHLITTFGGRKSNDGIVTNDEFGKDMEAAVACFEESMSSPSWKCPPRSLVFDVTERVVPVSRKRFTRRDIVDLFGAGEMGNVSLNSSWQVKLFDDVKKASMHLTAETQQTDWREQPQDDP
ncbi:Msx2-interacting protein [Zootermopsis nevadensis]|uniref:Msx2-interacting protein n=1 Tax=Zootermopsis nevadensis TaxID=136037 RepID=A0A067QW78_ZOONE|nr:Msx2-interacting protein [Zootermopsis nevadensis]